MQRKKQPEKILPVPELKSRVTEILVANGRSFQPFIRTFHYTGENITKSNLGTLIGVFEIDEMSEDCAYIVNFLASVAKKEYFSNSRRGAIESFEAALHKMNLALSELVKHGNVTWLGKFHGTLGVLEKNNIHFSVTGQATILLIRNEAISDISAGLASEESHIHPIKTFVEVSSGRLNLNDRIILTSPELLALFSLEELTKNARRMDNEQFLQFLKTALVNELDMAGAMLIDVEEEVIVEPSKTREKPAEEKSLERVSNIFSQSAFLPKKPNEPPTAEESLAQSQASEEALNKEYVDTKTGHIYVQGAPPKEPGKNAQLDQVVLGFEEFIDSSKLFLLSQGKWFRKGKKQLSLVATIIGEAFHTTKKRVGRALRRQWRTFRTPKTTPLPIPEKASVREPLIQDVQREILPVSDIPLPQKDPLILEPTTSFLEEAGAAPELNGKNELPHFIKEKLNSFYQKGEGIAPLSATLPPVPAKNPSFKEKVIKKNALTLKMMRDTLQRLSLSLRARMVQFWSSLTPLARKTYAFFKSLPDRERRIGLSIAIVSLVLVGAWYLWPSTSPESSITTDTGENPLRPTPSQADSVVPAPSEISLAFGSFSPPIITSVVLNEEVYVITQKNILSITEKKSYPLPNNSRAQFATTMDDLRLIFVATENNTLYAWSPISKTFVENTLTLAEGATVTGIDTYLTYLYVLDSTHDQVYRFPRAAGGFGESTLWLKDSVAIDATSHLAVNESLYIALDGHTLKGFFRGREGNGFETPTDLSITDLYTHPGLKNVYALDAEHKRVIIWNQDGKLIEELTHEKFSEGKTLSVNEKDGEIF
nr:hypothetical protein [Candidatus Moranbacteria bacterium]